MLRLSPRAGAANSRRRPPCGPFTKQQKQGAFFPTDPRLGYSLVFEGFPLHTNGSETDARMKADNSVTSSCTHRHHLLSLASRISYMRSSPVWSYLRAVFIRADLSHENRRPANGYSLSFYNMPCFFFFLSSIFVNFVN